MAVCTTCHQPGLTPGQPHDCPGYGEIRVSRQLGYGIRVDTAPARARMTVQLLANGAYGLSMPSADQINMADQVLYQIVGYDAESAALVLELVEDWRPAPTVQLPLTDEQAEDIKTRWKEQHGNGHAAHQVIVLEDQEASDA